MLGAGGSARAAVWALREAGASEVAVWNRTPERAQDARARSSACGPCARPAGRSARQLHLGGPATRPPSIERSATEDEALNQLGLTFDQLGEYSYVVDLVYRSGSTPLLAAAASAWRAHARRPGDPRRPGGAQLRAVDRAGRLRWRSCAALRAEDEQLAVIEPQLRGWRSMSDAPQQAGPDLHAIFGIDGDAARSSRADDLCSSAAACSTIPRRERALPTAGPTSSSTSREALAGGGPSRPAAGGRRGVRDDRRRRPLHRGRATSLRWDAGPRQRRGRSARRRRPSREESAGPDAAFAPRAPRSAFLTDVIVDMGLVSRKQVDDALANSRISGTTPERVLLESGALNQDGLARALGRALWPRPPRPRRLQRGHGGRQPRQHDDRQALPGGTRGVRRQAHAAGRDGRPVQRARGRRHRDHDRL